MNNDKKQFEKFYNDNFEKIYRFVFFRTNKHRELAEDLVSEIFMKALKNFDSFDENISHSAWIFTIAKNHLANYWRDNKPTASLPDEADEDANPDKFWYRQSTNDSQIQEDKLDVEKILSNLSEKEKQIVTFHYILGYNYAEIGEMLDQSPGNAKVIAHRALKKLKQPQ